MADMDLAIVHYHLNRGGVMQVIAGHLRALATCRPELRPRRVVIFYGGRHQGWPHELARELPFPISLHVVPELEYDDGEPPRPERLAEQVRQAFAAEGFSANETLLHVHNHALGKNLSLPGALRVLAAQGYRQLLQIHDFAEDLRPAMYRRLCQISSDPAALGEVLYPQAEHLHYAVLSSRDGGILQQAGLASERLHVLPNPIYELGPLPPRSEAREKLKRLFALPSDAPLLVYPVRAITRKNLGEALLWSAAVGDRAWVAVTQPPLNPAEQPLYRRWKELAHELQLPCLFEIGSHAELSLAESLAAADHLLTTSLAEGFGMVFLEAPLAGRALVGRDLPEITIDFARSGVRFPGLRPALTVPVEWVGGAEAFGEQFLQAYRQVLTTYQRPIPDAATLEKQCAMFVGSGVVDFGTLDAPLQEQVLRHVRSSESAQAQLLQQNPILGLALRPATEKECALAEENAEAVRSHYSLAICGEQLVRIYQQLRRSGVEPIGRPLAAMTILDAFLDVRRFRPLRS